MKTFSLHVYDTQQIISLLTERERGRERGRERERERE